MSDSFESFAGLDEDTIKLLVALTIARLSKLEGPWYGPWGIDLNRHLGKIKIKSDDGTDMVVPVIYAQYPIGITQEDLLDVEGNNMNPHQHENAVFPTPTMDSPIQISTSSDPLSSPSPKGAQLPQSSPVAPTQGGNRNHSRDPRIAMQNTSAPLPSLLSVMASMAGGRPSNSDSSDPIQPRTPPRTRDYPRSADLTRDDKEMLIAAYKIRSTRVPDFARCIYLIQGSAMVLMRWDLLVEIKKKLAIPDSEIQGLAFLNIRKQVMSQAEHIFASNPSVEVVGAILAFGDVWTYQEYHRPQDLSGVGTDDPSWRPEKSGPDSDGSSYVGSPTPSQNDEDAKSSPCCGSNPIPPIPHALNGIAVLGTRQSDEMLDMVRVRLEALNTRIWQGNRIVKSTPNKDALDSEMSDALDEVDVTVHEYEDGHDEDLRGGDHVYYHPVLGLYHPPPNLEDFMDLEEMHWGV
ncbi:hypothetical protein Hypma_014118 [Hypsizygus marmoreus]|uniref:Uncharacterized protein n=1 Tax=Hypsizygus marmoreus TaxID=39966 RepID=A0A369KE30_HYPMA|nr:hypothetical protein Hypma_014118 [Hypsizygus marmoreus]